ncbi:hypothetical protein SKAU_G00014290 [Synaphobranchus kaupii]|uniref:RUN domain-containing protein n=1 Tax=Synaphobranchus kaupii TaxID=118154 RepID=A0A9Q1JBJ3_SYNKA|nr:hypothetical protein SKAU_G00014290 [Synaphobranchus kaupii]
MPTNCPPIMSVCSLLISAPWDTWNPLSTVGGAKGAQLDRAAVQDPGQPMPGRQEGPGQAGPPNTSLISQHLLATPTADRMASTPNSCRTTTVTSSQDYFSLTERPPDEFCLSPDASSESLSIDLLQKKALVKAINRAVDLIVAHFGTSRDPGVKAKLGNSSVSPNVGTLILKYLCPAIRDILQDGLRGYVLDLIIGQRRNVPWSVVEASTQLGPSTRVLHGLYCKVSQYSELTSHSNEAQCLHLRPAQVSPSVQSSCLSYCLSLIKLTIMSCTYIAVQSNFNVSLRSLEFWFNHLYTHEDIVAAHFHPWGFLPLSQGACQPLFEDLLLLLQPPLPATLPPGPAVRTRARAEGSGAPAAQRAALLHRAGPGAVRPLHLPADEGVGLPGGGA